MSTSHMPAHLGAEGVPVAVPPTPGFQQVPPAPQQDLQALRPHCQVPFPRAGGQPWGRRCRTSRVPVRSAPWN